MTQLNTALLALGPSSAISGVAGKRYVYFCSNCREVLGAPHRRGSWMGQWQQGASHSRPVTMNRTARGITGVAP